MRRTNKALIFPWKKNPADTFIFLLCFLDLIPEEVSLTMWTVTVLSSQLRGQAAIMTVPDCNFPRLQTRNRQSHHPEPHKKWSNPAKTPPLSLEEDRAAWHQSYLSEKNYFQKGETGWERCGRMKQLPSLKPIKNKWQTLRCPSVRQTAFYFSSCPEAGQ